MKKKVNIAVVGLGNIGSYFCNEIIKKKREILLRTGKNLNLLYVSAKNKKKKDHSILTISNGLTSP